MGDDADTEGRDVPTTRELTNFRDPWGLAGRMLRSRDPAAWSTLGRFVTGVATSPLDRVLETAERRLLDGAGAPSQPLVLVVGGARTGTTMVSQLLASALPVSYFTNVTALFPRAPITATRLLRQDGRAAPASLHSYFGQTAGWAAPNDGFAVWNRWLGPDRYRVTRTLDDADRAGLQAFFGAWTAAFPRPFMNKNNRNADAVSQLADALPDAVFVAVHRDPLSVAQSLVLARAEVQGDPSAAWGLYGETTRAGAADPLGYLDDVAAQVHRAETRLRTQLDQLPASRKVELVYDDVCGDPADAVARVAGLLPGVQPRSTEVTPTTPSHAERLGAAEMRRLRRALDAAYREPTR